VTSPLRATDPTRLGPYQLLSRLGEGGMGTVFLGRGPDQRMVAVKVIRPEYAHDEEFRARFRSEVNRARQVPPFCTAEVLDADPDHPTPYLVVEYVNGPSLAEIIGEQGPLSGGNLHSVAVGVAAALAAIHGAGVIHRDLKPRNVLFSLGTPKVIDFGIARALEATSRHTRPAEMVGTVAYMAPERFDPDTDRNLSPAADVFAWAAVVTYAGTGRTPFAGDTPTVTAARILTQPPRLTGLPQSLAGVVGRALAKDPGDRPTAHELLDLLLAAGGEEAHGHAGALTVGPEVRRAAEAAQHSGRHTTRGPGRRRPAVRRLAMATGAAAVAAVMVGAGLALAHRDTGGRSATVAPSRPPPAAAQPVVQGPSIFDRLDRGGQWQDLTDVAGTCAFDRGLVVRTEPAGAMRCTYGPDDVFPGRQTIGVSVTLGSAGSCAAIWFRVVGANAYRLSVCPGAVTFGLDADGDLRPLATVPRTTATGTAHRVLITADNARAAATLDGIAVTSAPLSEPALATGQVVLGATGEHPGDRARVTFTGAEFRSGTPPAAPAEPAFATGDATVTARLWGLDHGERSAVVEPVRFLTGAQYCRRHNVAPTSQRCRARTVTEGTDVKVTMALGTGYRLREYRDGDARCTDPVTRAGRCPATTHDFSIWATEHSPFPARVTIKGGKVAEVAQLDLP
jgi:hypothetical protein